MRSSLVHFAENFHDAVASDMDHRWAMVEEGVAYRVGSAVKQMEVGILGEKE